MLHAVSPSRRTAALFVRIVVTLSNQYGAVTVPRPAMKKYDRRSITSAENGRRAWGMNLDAQVAELEERIRELAYSTSDERLKFEALKYLRDCRAGKPFTAMNPAERKASRTDNRVQIAAQTLILGQPSAPNQDLLAMNPTDVLDVSGK